MIKKQYTPPEIKVRVVYHNVMGLNITSEEDNDSRQSKQSSTTFLPFSYDEEEEPNSFYSY